MARWPVLLLVASCTRPSAAPAQDAAIVDQACRIRPASQDAGDARAELLRCTGVVASPLDPVFRFPAGTGELVEVQIASDASRGTDMAPPDVLVVWVEDAVIRAWAKSNRTDGHTIGARLETLAGERVIVARLDTTSWGAFSPGHFGEAVWLVRGKSLVRAGRYAVQQPQHPTLADPKPERGFVATSSFVGSQVIIDESSTWHYPGIVATRETKHRRTFTLVGDALVEDPGVVDTAPPWPDAGSSR